jgi:hypothetical protein
MIIAIALLLALVAALYVAVARHDHMLDATATDEAWAAGRVMLRRLPVESRHRRSQTNARRTGS